MTGEGAAAGPEPPADRVAGRYRLLAPLGSGASGTVYLARDEVLSEEVALKILADPRDARSPEGRRESAALRLLRIPGAVRLLDDGLHGGRRFLVMDRARGEPFPGRPAPAPWSALRGTVLGLLETLSRLHRLGILHGDLKASNVLVDGEGRATVLDFGLARGPAVSATSDRAGFLSGTPATMAPERFFGAPPSPRGDLYAVGVLIHEALTGRAPHAAPDLATLARLRRTAPPPPSSVTPGVPAEADRVCLALLAPEPGDRPEDAAAALRLFDGVDVHRGGPLPARPEDLFHGPDLVLRMRERAAAELRARAGTDEAAVRRELEAWQRAGLAVLEGDRLRLSRAAMDWLELGLPVGGGADGHRTRGGGGAAAALLARGDPDAVETEGVRLALDEGRLREGVALLKEALVMVRGRADGDGEARLLGRLLHCALLSLSEERIRETAWECDRRVSEGPRIAAVAALASAAMDNHRGNFRRARDVALALPPFEGQDLEWTRLAVAGLATRLGDPGSYERFLDGVERDLEGREAPELRAALCGWRAMVIYRLWRFVASAELHERAAAGTRWMPRRLMALSDAVVSRFCAGQMDRARSILAEALPLARAAGAHDAEFLLHLHERSLEVARPGARPCPPDLIEGLGALITSSAPANHFLREAALLWRRGDADGARRLLARVDRTITRHGWSAMEFLVDALLLVLDGAAVDDARVTTLAAAARTPSLPAGGVQCLALLALATGTVLPAWREAAAELMAHIPAPPDDLRREVLSLRESLDILEGRRSEPEEA